MGLLALRPGDFHTVSISLLSHVNPMKSTLVRRRVLNVLCCVTGCAVLAGVGFYIWQSVHQGSQNQTVVLNLPGGVDELEKAPSTPLTEPKKFLDLEQPPSAGRDDAIRQAGLAVPAEVKESFDKAKEGGLPAGWSQWSSGKGASFEVAAAKGLTAPNVLTSSGASNVNAYAWFNGAHDADFQASVGINLTTLISAGALVRGSKLDSGAPTYYAATVMRGVEMTLWKAVDGKQTKLGRLKSTGYFSEKWARLTIQADGKTIRARLCRLDDLQYLNKDGAWQIDPTWALSVNDGDIAGGGEVGVLRLASGAGSVSFDDFDAGSSSNDTPPKGTGPAKPANPNAPPAGTPPKTVANPLHEPPIPRHYSHIRIAMLAYAGTPMGKFEDDLLKNSVDLVIPNVAYLKHINEVSPKTPALIYSNCSNLYLELLTDWLAFADAHGMSREAAFYHASHPLPFKGDSASSRPVTWFWGVYRGGNSPSDHTSAAHSKTGKVDFATHGESLYLGFPDRFREINLDLASGAKGGWSAVLEYAKAVDKNDKPTEWVALKTTADSTKTLTQSGTIEFDPPADWKAGSVGNSAHFYYVRFRTTANGAAPVARTLLGRDFVGAKGTTEGVIPAFDPEADLNKDGYLDDAEYAKRKPGKDARFLYESRVFSGYGQMRYATNPGSPDLHKWAADYHVRFLAKNPLASGIFMDNSAGKPQVKAPDVVESPANYSAEYGQMVQAVWRAIEPKWILSNTGGGYTSAEPVIQQCPAYFEEFAIRPLSHGWSAFDDLAAMVERRSLLTKPSPVAVIDSHAQGGKQDDARVLIGVLTYYYLFADPDTTFLMFYGGQDPNGAWTKHWTAAVSYDVGKPTGKWSEFATGTDPANKDLTYKVLQRTYTNALILHKPLSHVRGNRTRPEIGDESATKVELKATYRPLQADGTLGAPVTSISLRNGEGAILIKEK
jgi:hypothetical protein